MTQEDLRQFAEELFIPKYLERNPQEHDFNEAFKLKRKQDSK